MCERRKHLRPRTTPIVNTACDVFTTPPPHTHTPRRHHAQLAHDSLTKEEADELAIAIKEEPENVVCRSCDCSKFTKPPRGKGRLAASFVLKNDKCTCTHPVCSHRWPTKRDLAILRAEATADGHRCIFDNCGCTATSTLFWTISPVLVCVAAPWHPRKKSVLYST